MGSELFSCSVRFAMTYLTREDIRDHLEDNADGEGNLWCTQTVRLS